jgi:hypothetical protein
MLALVVGESAGVIPDESGFWHSSLPHDNSVGLVVHQ